MALFPVNQNAQFFTPTAEELTNLQTISTSQSASGAMTEDWKNIMQIDNKVFFRATSGSNVITSDIINVCNGGFIKYTSADDMKSYSQGVKIVLDTDTYFPVAGETYGVYINQRGYQALGERHFAELGAEVVYNGLFDFNGTTDQTKGHIRINSTNRLLAALALGLKRNLGESEDNYMIILGSDVIEKTTDVSGSTATELYIITKEQEWLPGTMQRERVQLSKQDVHLSEITVNTIPDVVDWAIVTDVDAKNSTTPNVEGTSWSNSKDVADMEWFYLGEHGDQMRLKGFPYINPAQLRGNYYHIDAMDADGYDIIQIHHAYQGNGMFIQKSERDIFIALKDGEAVAKKFAEALGCTNYDTLVSKKVLTF